MSGQQIIMNFSRPPDIDDLEVIANAVLESMPTDLLEFCKKLSLQIEDIPDEVLEHDLDLEDPYELVTLYRKGSELSPGIEVKTANDDDVLVIFRRPLLDMWCEVCEDLASLMRQVIIEEIGRQFDFSDTEIDEMVGQHHQGLL